eukprot:1685783-Pyramimonas_sp.AAC.1
MPSGLLPLQSSPVQPVLKTAQWADQRVKTTNPVPQLSFSGRYAAEHSQYMGDRFNLDNQLEDDAVAGP